LRASDTEPTIGFSEPPLEPDEALVEDDEADPELVLVTVDVEL
jgi:hypothetical protein